MVEMNPDWPAITKHKFQKQTAKAKPVSLEFQK